MWRVLWKAAGFYLCQNVESTLRYNKKNGNNVTRMRTGNPFTWRKYGHSKQCNEVVQHLSQYALTWAVLGNNFFFIKQREKFPYLLKLRNLFLKRKYLLYTKVDLAKVCWKVNAVLLSTVVWNIRYYAKFAKRVWPHRTLKLMGEFFQFLSNTYVHLKAHMKIHSG